jgi:hypothetical protein
MIETTIEQSRCLLELGLDPKTADMVWVRYAAGGYRLEVLHRELFERIMETDIAAWSLSALLEVGKCPENGIPVDLALYTTCNNGWVCIYERGLDKHETRHENKTTAVYEMVCWLLEQGLIKKGDNNESKD